jgi:hypothetical protein
MFEPRGGKYICHAMLADAVPVLINAVTGKREAGGYECSTHHLCVGLHGWSHK